MKSLRTRLERLENALRPFQIRLPIVCVRDGGVAICENSEFLSLVAAEKAYPDARDIIYVTDEKVARALYRIFNGEGRECDKEF